MMKITWKRALSAVLTICMIATLLVVPAAAAAERQFRDFTSSFAGLTAAESETTGFVAVNKSDGTFRAGKSDFKNVSYQLYGATSETTSGSSGTALKFETSTRLKFFGSTEAPGTVYMYVIPNTAAAIADDKAPLVEVEKNGTAADNAMVAKLSEPSSNFQSTATVYSFETEVNATYTIGNSGTQFRLGYIEWIPATPHAVTVDSSISGGSVSTDAASEGVFKGTKVTVTATPDGENTLRTLKYTVSGKEPVDITATDGVYSFVMPDDDVTISATFGEACGHEGYETEQKGGSPATCTQAGKQDSTYCKNCGGLITEGEVIAALGHDLQDVADSAVAPTCTADGKEADKECSRCKNTDEADVADQSGKKGTKVGAVILRTGHTFDADGVCTTDGCSVTCPESLEFLFTTIAGNIESATPKGYILELAGNSSSGADQAKCTYTTLAGASETLTGNHIKFDANGKLVFKAPAAGTLKLCLDNLNASSVKTLTVQEGAAATGAVKTADENGVLELTTTANEVITLSRDSGNQARLFAMNWTKTATAPTEYDVTVTAPTNGTVSVSPTKAAENAEVTITATASEGYEVDTITVTKDSDSSAVTVTGNKFTMPGEAVTVTVTFKATVVTPTTKTITFTIPTGVTVKPKTSSGEDLPMTDNKVTVDKSASVTFVLEVAAGYQVDSVTGADSSASGVYTVTADAVVITASKAKVDLATKTVSVDKTAPVVGDTITATVSDSIPAADVDFIWTVGETQIAAKTATYKVTAADVGKVIKVKAQAKSGSDAYENATAEVSTAVVPSQTMTLTAAAVTKTYDGKAASITVNGAPDEATITYCLTADGTYAATLPEMKNAGDYTVYFKATAPGYTDASGSTTVKINKADVTITVSADLTDDIPYAQTDVTFTATGVPKDSEAVLTGHCTQAEADVNITFDWNTEKTVCSGVSHVAENTTPDAKTHTVAFTWPGDDNYNAATIANVVLNQVAHGAVSATPATGLAVDNKFADKGVTANAASGVNITIDEAAVLAAFNADKTAFQAAGVMHGNDAYIMVSFDAPEGFDKTTWTVQQLVNGEASSTNPWKLDGSDSSNELDVVGNKIGDWFCILKGVNGNAPTMPNEGTYRMTYRFYDGDNVLQAIYTYTATRAVTPAQEIVPLVHIFDAANATAAVAAIGDAATVTTGKEVGEFMVAKSSDNNPFGGFKAEELKPILKGVELEEVAKLTNPARSLSFAVPAAGTMTLYFLNTAKADAVSIDNGVGEKAVPVGYSAVTFTTTAQTYVITPVGANSGDDTGLPFLYAVVWTPDGTTACTHDAAKLVKTEQNVGADAGKVWAYCNDDPMCFAMVQVDAPVVTTKYTVTVNVGEHGSATSTFQASEGDDIAITATPDVGYEVDAITSDDVTITNGQFKMPAKDVTVNVTFKAVTVTPPPVNKDALTAAITAAQAVDTTSVVVSVDGTDVITSEKWIAKSVKDAFDKALADANAVAKNTKATQTEVDAAKEALTTATTAINEAIENAQSGTKPVTKADLTAAIETAETAANAIKVATSASSVSKGTKWVTEEDKAAYETAIAAAKTVAENEEATDEEVAEALAALNLATRVFEAAKQDGSKSNSTGGYRPSTPTEDTTPNKKTETLGDGTHRVTETKSDGSVTVTDTKTDGTKAVTTTTSAGEITTEVTLGRTTKTAKVTVPVDNAESGMVAIVVNDDGTEKIIRDSLVVDGDMVFELGEDAKVKIVNNAKSFVDVTGHWAKSDVDFVSARELFNGVDATHFAPDTSMTRGMMATVLFRLNGEIEGKKSVDFTDVVSGDWFANAVDWASEIGIINGYTDGSFGPNRSVTREELVVMIYRYAGAPAVEGSELSDFADGDVVANWATAAMTWAIQNKIIQGRGSSMIDPKGNATRAEVSAVLQRYVRLSK